MFPQCGRHLTPSCKTFFNLSFSYSRLILPIILSRDSATRGLTQRALVYLQEEKTLRRNCVLTESFVRGSTIAGLDPSPTGQTDRQWDSFDRMFLHRDRQLITASFKLCSGKYLKRACYIVPC